MHYLKIITYALIITVVSLIFSNLNLTKFINFLYSIPLAIYWSQSYSQGLKTGFFVGIFSDLFKMSSLGKTSFIFLIAVLAFSFVENMLKLHNKLTRASFLILNLIFCISIDEVITNGLNSTLIVEKVLYKIPFTVILTLIIWNIFIQNTHSKNKINSVIQ